MSIILFFFIESISLLKWAKSEENLALQDVFSKAFEVSCMWTSSWRDFNHEVTFDETGSNFYKVCLCCETIVQQVL